MRRAVARAVRRVLACRGVLLACAAAASEGCTTHQCDSDTVEAPPGIVRVNGQDVLWESGPLIPTGDGGAWLDFRGQRTFVFHFPPPFAEDTEITGFAPYVSASADASDPTNPNFILASGNLAEVTSLSGTGISVMNATCAPYFLRLEVRGHLFRGDAGAILASADASAE
ncbi:MAG: hypothetical protein M3O50_09150 [Myxococcota bacterium]|nr:hypothetical protein [Myxococcota bacterium]